MIVLGEGKVKIFRGSAPDPAGRLTAPSRPPAGFIGFLPDQSQSASATPEKIKLTYMYYIGSWQAKLFTSIYNIYTCIYVHVYMYTPQVKPCIYDID